MCDCVSGYYQTFKAMDVKPLCIICPVRPASPEFRKEQTTSERETRRIAQVEIP